MLSTMLLAMTAICEAMADCTHDGGRVASLHSCMLLAQWEGEGRSGGDQNTSAVTGWHALYQRPYSVTEGCNVMSACDPAASSHLLVGHCFGHGGLGGDIVGNKVGHGIGHRIDPAVHAAGGVDRGTPRQVVGLELGCKLRR